MKDTKLFAYSDTRISLSGPRLYPGFLRFRIDKVSTRPLLLFSLRRCHRSHADDFQHAFGVLGPVVVDLAGEVNHITASRRREGARWSIFRAGANPPGA